MIDRQLQVRCRVLLAIWIVAIVVVSLQAGAHHNNNFVIFRTAWENLTAGRDLYARSDRHFDYFMYSPTFAVLFAPMAVVPFTAGVLLWNALNGGALYWGLGRVLGAEAAFAARAIVLLDAIGSMQNVQSNALIAGLIIIGFAELERRREATAAAAIGVASLIKIFPLLAASFAIFRPYRIPRFALWSAVAAAVLLAAPLLVVPPSELAQQYASWFARMRGQAELRNYSVMEQLHIWLGVGWPNWPIQLAGLVVLFAPLVQVPHWNAPRFRLFYLASLLMFCVLFNHKAESPSFVIALAGVALWFVTADRTPFTWAVLVAVIVITSLSASDAMPEVLQQGVFMPYKLKTLPVLLVWILTQIELWRRKVSAPVPPLAAT
jgi:hypothetical protein